MSEHWDAIVVGAGTMGVAATLELARRGKRVLAIDRFGVPNDRASHHGATRFFRTAYFEHPDYVPLLVRAREGWARLEAESGERLFERTGMLLIGPRGGAIVEPTIESAKAHGIEHEVLSRADVRARYPMFEVAEDSIGVYEPGAGCLACEKAIGAMARLARGRGATFLEHTPVVDWSADARGVAVRTAGQTYRADKLVLTQGAWSGELARELGIKLRVTRQVMFWLAPPGDGPSAPPGLPVWAVETKAGADSEEDAGGVTFGFPLVLGEKGLKTCSHTPGRVSDPDALDREVTDADERPIRAFLSRHAPALDTARLDARVCMYTMICDEHFVIDRHPRHENVVIACGFSGHGFKFAPIVGATLAYLLLSDGFGPPHFTLARRASA